MATAAKAKPRKTTGDRDRARGSEVSRPRSEDAARKKYQAQKKRVADAKARGDKPRPQDITDADDVAQLKRDDQIAKGRERIDNAPSGAGAMRVVSTSMSPVFVPFVAQTALIVADETVRNHRMPIPSRFVAAFALFGTLGFASGEWEGVARALGWSVVLATFYNVVTQSPSTLSGVGSILAGNAPGTPGSSGVAGSAQLPSDRTLTPAGLQAEAGRQTTNRALRSGGTNPGRQ